MAFGSAPISLCGKVTPTCTLNLLSVPYKYTIVDNLKGEQGELLRTPFGRSSTSEIHLPRTPVNKCQRALLLWTSTRAQRTHLTSSRCRLQRRVVEGAVGGGD